MKANLNKRSSFMIVPMGLVGLADLAEREGFSARILNYPLERGLDKRFSLRAYLGRCNPAIVGVDLHWAVHSAGAIDTLRFVKKHFPGAFTLLGGYSATWYAREIMEAHDFVDGIVQGDAEVPIVQLLKDRRALDKVANLIYREGGKVKDNGISYVAQEIDSPNFARVKLIEHWREYIETSYHALRNPFCIEMARGCPFNCIFCGGAEYCMRRIVKRDEVIFRSPARVVDDIKEFIAAGTSKAIFFGHGVYPATEAYFTQINKLIRDEGIDLQAELEAWRLPVSRAFIEDFARTYDRTRSIVWFSPRSFSATYRKKFTTMFGAFDDSLSFSDKQLYDFILDCQANGMINVLFWDMGYPHETAADAFRNYVKAVKVILYGQAKKKRVGVITEPMLVSPGCIADLFDTKMGLRVRDKSFKEQVALGRRTAMRVSPWDVVSNYRTTHFSERVLYLINKVTWFTYGYSFVPVMLFH
ncbi:MAG: cobalamin-dependent protein [Candidatus Lokiarchaeota archaeon]|nr:cobalamin-dependent protein [Candidatus Lokiarchaeota archaeon]